MSVWRLAPLLVCFAAFAVAARADSPVTTSIESGPPAMSTANSVTLAFHGTGAASFECSLDGADFAPCASPAKEGPLRIGPHTFSVRAVGEDGQPDPNPAQWKWETPALTLATVKVKLPKRSVRLSQLRVITGTASAPSGVSRVQLALTQGKPDKDYFPPACNFFDLETGRHYLQPCLLPQYVTITGTTKWRYRVPKRVRQLLRPGRYELIVRAFNGYSEAARPHFKLTLR